MNYFIKSFKYTINNWLYFEGKATREEFIIFHIIRFCINAFLISFILIFFIISEYFNLTDLLIINIFHNIVIFVMLLYKFIFYIASMSLIFRRINYINLNTIISILFKLIFIISLIFLSLNDISILFLMIDIICSILLFILRKTI